MIGWYLIFCGFFLSIPSAIVTVKYNRPVWGLLILIVAIVISTMGLQLENNAHR